MAGIIVAPPDSIAEAAVVVPGITLGAVAVAAPCAIAEAQVGDPFDIFPDQAVVEAAVDGVCTVAWPPTDASAAEAVAVAPSINLGNVLVNRPIAAVEAGFSPPIVTWAWPEPIPVPAEAALVDPVVLFGATGVEPGAASIEGAAVAPGIAYGSVAVAPSVAAAEADIRAHEQRPPWIAEGKAGAFSIVTGAA